jgi:serine/threonine-protein kinase HipA
VAPWKNFSIFLGRGDAYRLTPLYNVISIWPYIGDAPNRLRWRAVGLAMALRSKDVHYALRTIHARHWQALTMSNGGESLWEAMCGLVGRVPAALAAVERRLPGDLPGRTWDAIASGVRSQARRSAPG